jgi:uncharacterized LabA/DUF88 family protein
LNYVNGGGLMTSPRITNEVAIFIDLENVRYSSLNLFGQEPNFGLLLEKAKKYGRPSVIRAYADFSEHQQVKQQLHICGIEAINIVVKRIRKPGKNVERVKNAADMFLALDAILEAANADNDRKVKTFLLVSGDADYIKLVTLLRNRFGQKVIISGVPGAVGQDLVASADGEDNIEYVKPEPVDKQILKSNIVAMVKKGCAPSLKFWTLRTIDQWSESSRQKIDGTTKEKRDAIHELVEEAVLRRESVDLSVIGKRGTAMQVVLDEQKAKELGYLE